ncbi:MAG: GNAT family protein [Oscillospiraceae bacterium]|nr:GNAT family protein [Oscillospiraceae bacterium]
MLRLRPFRSPDAQTIVSWTSEPEEFYKWSAGIMGDFPVSEKRFLEMVSAREDNTGFFPLVAFDESGPAGFFIVRTPGEDDRKVRFGFVIVDPRKRGHGYGSQMLRLGLKFMFEIYGAQEVSLGVFEHNLPAYHCYQSVGFRETGVRKIYHLCGKDWIDIEMAIS